MTTPESIAAEKSAPAALAADVKLEYDAKELAQRASQVTSVLDRILKDHPATPPRAFQRPASPAPPV